MVEVDGNRQALALEVPGDRGGTGVEASGDKIRPEFDDPIAHGDRASAAGWYAAAGTAARGASRPPSRYRRRSRCRWPRLMPYWAAAAVTDNCAETTLRTAT